MRATPADLTRGAAIGRRVPHKRARSVGHEEVRALHTREQAWCSAPRSSRCLEPPRGAAHQPRTRRRQHRHLRVRRPDAPDTVTLVGTGSRSRSPPAARTSRVRRRRALRHQRRQQRRRRRRHHLRVPVQDLTPEPDTFLYNTGPIDVARRPEPERAPDLLGHASRPRRHATVTRRATSPTPPVNIGPRSTPNYDQLAAAGDPHAARTASKVFAGQRDDPFFVDLGSVFDLLASAVQRRARHPAAGEPGVDGVGATTCTRIALQVPKSPDHDGSSARSPTRTRSSASGRRRYRRQVRVAGDGRRPSRSDCGRWVQVSRLGMPLVNEVVIPLGQEGPLQRLRARATTRSSARTCSTPSWPG